MYENQETTQAALALGFDYGLGRVHLAGYLQRIVALGLPHERWTHWDTTATTLDAISGLATHSNRSETGSAVVVDLTADAGWIALVTINRGVLRMYASAATIDALDAGEAFLRERCPVLVATEDQTIPISFWCYGSHGAAESTRSIDVPTWSDIRRNYPGRVAAQLEDLMSPEFRPNGRGQLILWYGKPGTGKTYGLRALGWQWRSWCSFHYVTDPESFFGRPDYMLDVLLGDEDEDGEEPRWRILLLEDTGELLAADAKAQSGQGLSRLLNVVDGIIGQGLRLLVLVTTNDELHQLHPAVSRAGRCLARVEFTPFATEEAESWLEENGVESQAGRSGTLASLFATAAGEVVPERPAVGFVR